MNVFYISIYTTANVDCIQSLGNFNAVVTITSVIGITDQATTCLAVNDDIYGLIFLN